MKTVSSFFTPRLSLRAAGDRRLTSVKLGCRFKSTKDELYGPHIIPAGVLVSWRGIGYVAFVLVSLGIVRFDWFLGGSGLSP